MIQKLTNETMAYSDQNREVPKDVRARLNGQYEIPGGKTVTKTGLDILYTSQIDRGIIEEDVGRKISSLKHLLEKDPRAADLKWSLFVAASNTYRYDSCLKPFPPMYIKNECKDIDALRRAIESVPPLLIICKELGEANVYQNYGETIELLYWVLLRLRDPHIKSVQKEYYNSILRKVPLEVPVAAPNLIFQIANMKQSASEEKWKSSAKDRSTFYAYHGSRLENFHSIVHYGLQQNMCKRSEFGKGIYFSSELGVSLPYSPVGYGWGGSLLGSEISCIALCELVNHPDIKRGDSRDNAQNMLSDSVGGRIPDKYFVVTNSDLVRIRYLLVYTQDLHTTSTTDNAGLLSWFKQHKLLTFVLGYVVLLASVGLTQNKQKITTLSFLTTVGFLHSLQALAFDRPLTGRIKGHSFPRWLGQSGDETAPPRNRDCADSSMLTNSNRWSLLTRVGSDSTCATYFSKEETEIRACNRNKGPSARLRLTMATRNRITVTVNHANQENIKSTKPSMAIVPSKGKRAVLGEISNRVNTLRGVEPIDRISLMQKKKVPVPKRPAAVKPVANPPEKQPVQIVKPQVVKITSSNVNNASNVFDIPTIVSQKREERNSFSTDLLKFDDIDEQDKNNPILVSLYTSDIHEYLRTLEKKFVIRKGYLMGQEVTPKMRCVLVDWLVEVHQQFHLMQETLYLTIGIIDRFLQLFRTIDRKKLQLVGVTAMFIASKYEEMYSPDISDFVYITDKAYSKVDILNMEMLIVKTLDYSFGRPLPLHFLRRYSKAGKALPIHHTMAKYFLEQSLVYYEMCHYPPSLVAAAAIYLAFIIIGNDEENEGKIIWTDTLAYYSTYSKDDVLPAVRDIAAIIINAENSKYQAVRKKYVHVKHMKISIRPELKSPILLSIAAKRNESNL